MNLVQKKLSLALFGLSAIFASSAFAQTTDNSLQAVKDSGELRVAVFSDKPPFGYVDREGNSQGYDIELAKALGQNLFGSENSVKFVLTEAQNRINVLDANKVDLTLANFTVTPTRSEQVDFAEPYMKVAIGLVTPEGAQITDLADLNGKTIIVNKGTTAETYFEKHHPEVKLQKYDHNSEAFSELKDGRAVGVAHDNALLYAWAKNNPEFVVSIQKIGPDDVIAPAVKKGNGELLNWVNAQIQALQAEEFFHKAYDKSVKPFYGDNIDPDNIVIDASNKSK